MLLALMSLVLAQPYATNLPFDHAAIRYGECAPDDPVARLQRQLDRHGAALDFGGEGLGYLPSVLKLLGINADSQALVFSKTSFQASKISPRNPRAIYFNDEVAIGFLPGQGLELAALDPRQGIVFYTLTGLKSDKPTFIRSQTCLRCHQGPATAGVPGIFIGSVYPGPTGQPSREDAIITDHTTAFEDRWGGWYINAKRGQPRDRSNAVAPDPAEPHELVKLDRFFNPAPYLSPTSDIVALMTFEHQTQMINLLTRLGWELRMGLTPDLNPVVSYMTFAREAKLKEPIEGVSSFTKTFPEAGPRDRKGRSLRDFDLETRLFKYPLSYMIYSPQFDALPQATRNEIYAKIKSKPIVEILCDTKHDLPAAMCR
jgi:hypothetical protein